MVLQNIPIPPSMNNAYATILIKGISRRIKSRDMRAWEKLMDQWAKGNETELFCAREYLKNLQPGRYLKLDSHFEFKHERILCKSGKPKRNDTSNRLKLLHDKLCDILGVDDCWIWDGEFSKRVTNGPEKCTVSLFVEQLEG